MCLCPGPSFCRLPIVSRRLPLCLAPRLDQGGKLLALLTSTLGMMQLHSHGFLHGNIRPENIMLREQMGPDAKLRIVGVVSTHGGGGALVKMP